WPPTIPTGETVTDTDEDEQRVAEIDVAEGELIRTAEDGTLSALTRVRVWDLIRKLSEEKAELLQLDQAT
ncbi:MAG: hypothetical protein ACRDRN_23520, partial [Sciscionella sp.]